MSSVSNSPISRLSADVLVELFTLIAHTDPPGPFDDDMEYDTDDEEGASHNVARMGWIRLSHVCVLWRDIITLRMPSLWAEIVLMFPEVATVLERARDMPIVLHMTRNVLQSSPWSAIRDFIQTHCGRAQTLNLRIFDLEDSETWSACFNSHELPQLRELHLLEEGDTRPRNPPPTPLRIRAPGLRSATIGLLRYPSYTLHAPLLVSLDVMHYDRFDSKQLLEVLSGTSLLECLRVNTWPPAWEDAWLSSELTALSLSHLCRVKIRGNMRNGIPLLRILSRTAHIRQLVIEKAREEGTKFHAALEAVVPSLMKCAPFDSLFISCGRLDLRICAFNMHDYDPETHTVFEPPRGAVYLDIHVPSPMRAGPARLIAHFCSYVRLSHIRHLVFVGRMPEGLAGIWADMSSVTSLALMINPPSVEDQLAATENAARFIRKQYGNGRAVLPRLQTLTICACMHFRHLTENDRSQWWDHVIDALWARRQLSESICRFGTCSFDNAKDQVDRRGVERVAELVETVIVRRKP